MGKKHNRQRSRASKNSSMQEMLSACVEIAMDKYPPKNIIEAVTYMCMSFEAMYKGTPQANTKDDLLYFLKESPVYKQNLPLRFPFIANNIVETAQARVEGLYQTLLKQGVK